MQIIKKIKPANVVDKDSMFHILGGNNTNTSDGCTCQGSGDNIKKMDTIMDISVTISSRIPAQEPMMIS